MPTPTPIDPTIIIGEHAPEELTVSSQAVIAKTREIIMSLDGRLRTKGELITEVAAAMSDREDVRLAFASSPAMMEVVDRAAGELAKETSGRSGLRTIDGKEYVSGYWVEPEAEGDNYGLVEGDAA